MSIRRLRVLIEHLPPESTTKTAMRNAAPVADVDQATAEYRPDRAQWSGMEMLLATLTDEVRMLRMVTVAANGGTPGDFTPIPRPGIPPKTAQQHKRLTDEQRRAIDPRLRNQPKEA